MQKDDLLQSFCTYWAGTAAALPLPEGNTASLQQKGEGWYCQFCHRGKRQTFAIGKVSAAEAKAAHVDYLLMRLGQGLIELPPGVDVVTFVRHDGDASRAAPAPPAREPLTLGALHDRYLARRSRSCSGTSGTAPRMRGST